MPDDIRSILDKVYGIQTADTTSIRLVLDRAYGREEPDVWERIKAAAPGFIRRAEDAFYAGVPQLAAMALAPDFVYKRIKEPEPWVEATEAGMVGLGRGLLTMGIAPPTEIERKHPIASMVGEAASLPVAGLTGVGMLPAIGGQITRRLLPRAAGPIGRAAVEMGTRAGIAAGVTGARQAVQKQLNPRDILFNAASAAVSVVPEYSITPGAWNFIGQVATDLGADVTTDTLRRVFGEKGIPPVISVRWLAREVPQLIPSVTFAARDVTRRGRAELAAKQGKAEAWRGKPEIVIGEKYPGRVAAVPRGMQPIQPIPGIEPGEALGLPPGPPPRIPRPPSEPSRTFYGTPEGKMLTVPPEQQLQIEIEGYWQRISTRTRVDGKPLKDRGLKAYQSRYDKAVTQLRDQFGIEARGVYRGEGSGYVDFIETGRPTGVRRRFVSTEEMVLPPRAEVEERLPFYEMETEPGRILGPSGRPVIHDLRTERERLGREYRGWKARKNRAEMERVERAIIEIDDRIRTYELGVPSVIEGEIPKERIGRRAPVGMPSGTETLVEPIARVLKPVQEVETEIRAEPAEQLPIAQTIPPRTTPRITEPSTWPQYLSRNNLFLLNTDIRGLYPDIARGDPKLYRKIVRTQEYGGRPIDQIADELQRAGVLHVPDEYTSKPSDYLMELLKRHAPFGEVLPERVPPPEEAREVPLRTIPAAELEQGDRFTMRGEEYQVTSATDAEIRIENGEPRTLDPFDSISIDEGSLKAAPGFELTAPEIRARRPEPLEQLELGGMPGREIPRGKIGEGVGTTLEGTALEESRVAAKKAAAQGAGLFEGEEPVAPKSIQPMPPDLVRLWTNDQGHEVGFKRMGNKFELYANGESIGLYDTALEAKRVGDNYTPPEPLTTPSILEAYDPKIVYDTVLDVEESLDRRDWPSIVDKLRSRPGYEGIDERSAKAVLAEVFPDDPDFRQARLDMDAEDYAGPRFEQMHSGITPKDIGESLRSLGILATPAPKGVRVEGAEPGLGWLAKAHTPRWKLKHVAPLLEPVAKMAGNAYDQMKLGMDRLQREYIDPAGKVRKKIGKAERAVVEELLWRGDEEGRTFDSTDPEYTALSPDAKQFYAYQRDYYDHLHSVVSEFREAMGMKPLAYRTGYLPHRFLGNWQVLINGQSQIRTNPDGSETLFFDTQDEAVRFAADLIKDQPVDLLGDPDFDMVIRQKMVQWPNGGAMPLSAKHYWTLTNRLEKLLEIPKDDAIALTKGEFYIAKPERKRRFFGPAMERKGQPGYETEVMDLMRYYGWTTQRYMAMAEFEQAALRQLSSYFGLEKTAKATQVIDTLKLGKAPQRHPTLQMFMARYMEDVLGRPTPEELWSDAFLANIGKQFPILDQWLGRPYTTRRMAQTAARPVVLAKLGGLMSGAVNLSQTALNTYPVLKERWTSVGIRDAMGAYTSHLLGKDNADFKVLQDLGVSLYTPKYQEGFHRGKVSGILLFTFNKAETLNRAVAGLGSYKKTLYQLKKQGITGEVAQAKALDAAKDLIEETHFRYDVAGRPEILRGPIGGTLGMFKSYAIKELEFAFDLGEKFVKGEDFGALPRFMAVGIGLGGVLGVPGITVLNELGRWMFGRSFLSESRQWLIDKFNDKIPGSNATVGEVLSYGIGAVADVDLSWRVGPGDLFPTAAEDFLGPHLSTGTRIIQAARKSPRTGEKVREYVPREIAPGLMKHAKGLYDLALELTGKEPEPIEGRYRGRKEFEPTTKERVVRAVGGRTITEAKTSDVRALEAQAERKGGDLRVQAIDGMIEAMENNDIERGEQWMREALQRNVIITASDLQEEIEKKGMSRLGRLYREIPKNQREAYIQRLETFGLTEPLEEIAPRRQKEMLAQVQQDIMDQFAQGDRKGAWKHIRAIGMDKVFPGRTAGEIAAVARRHQAEPGTFRGLVGEIELTKLQEQVIELLVEGKRREAGILMRDNGGMREVFKTANIRTMEALNNEVRRRKAYKEAG